MILDPECTTQSWILNPDPGSNIKGPGSRALDPGSRILIQDPGLGPGSWIHDLGPEPWTQDPRIQRPGPMIKYPGQFLHIGTARTTFTCKNCVSGRLGQI